MRVVLGRTSTLVTNMALIGGGVVTGAILSRALGPEGRGEYVSWQTGAAAISVLALGGLPQAIVLDTRVSGRHRLIEVVAPMGASLAIAAAGILFFALFSGPTLPTTVALILIALATQCGALAASESQRMSQFAAQFNVVRLAPIAAAFLAMVTLMAFDSRATTEWLLAVGAAQAVATGACLVGVTQVRGGAREAARVTLREAATLAVGNTATVLQYRFDLLIVAMLFPPSATAFYATGIAAQAAVLAAGQAHGMLWFSARNEKRTPTETRTRSVRNELWRTAITALAVAVPLACTADIWVDWVYGTAFRPAVPIVAVLCGVGVLQSLDYLLVHECLLLGRGRRIPLYRLPTLVVLPLAFWGAYQTGWSTLALAFLPAGGYALSCLMLIQGLRTRSSHAE